VLHTANILRRRRCIVDEKVKFFHKRNFSCAASEIDPQERSLDMIETALSILIKKSKKNDKI
jgi:hypothetical protein